MPKRVEIDDDLYALAETKCPKYLSVTGFLNLLIDQTLDRAGTLGVTSAAGTPSSSSSSSSIPKSINTKSKSKGRNEGKNREAYPPEFEAFWKAYQSLPERASKQSKPLALAAWKEASLDHTTDDLQRAVGLQLAIQERELRSERGFTVAMPDCFRWLRDECYVALLEDHKPAQPSKPSWILT